MFSLEDVNVIYILADAIRLMYGKNHYKENGLVGRFISESL